MTADVIKKLIVNPKPLSMKEVLDTIHQIIKDDTDPIFIPSKQQKVGTCSLSNAKKNLKGILACLHANDVYGNLSDESIKKSIALVNKWYKQFTNETLRNNAIDKLIKLSKTCVEEFEKYSTVFFQNVFSLVENYIRQHMHEGKDKERVKRLFQNLPDVFKIYLVQRLGNKFNEILDPISDPSPPSHPVLTSFELTTERKTDADTLQEKTTPTKPKA